MANVEIQEDPGRRRRRDASERRVGRALADALREGNRFRDQQERFRSYLNAHAVAADIIHALTRYPGFVEIDQQKVMAKMTEVTKAVARIRTHITKQLKDQHDIETKHPDQIAQITRLAAQAVIRQWGDDGRLFDKLPSGDTITSDETKMVLTSMYMHYVSTVVTQEDLEDPEGGEGVDDEELDRVLAAYSVFLRIDDAVNEFRGMVTGAEQEIGTLLWGGPEDVDDPPIPSPDDLTHRIVDLVVFPTAKRREEAILGTFDPESRFSARERRVTYRAMMNHVSRDVAVVIRHEGEHFLNRVLAMTDHERQTYVSPRGLMVDWLNNRVNRRLDRLYPQPLEYVDREDAPAASGATARTQMVGGRRSGAEFPERYHRRRAERNFDE